MSSSADVVIVGAGIVGASVAWHLVRGGCANVRLLEREPHQGRGSTGKSMGGVRVQFGTDVNIRMSRYSIPFYARFDDLVGHPGGYAPQGYLLVATTTAHMALLRANHARQRANDVHDVSLLDREGVMARAPLLRPDDIVGGSFGASDGFVDPHSAMTGFTRGALEGGATLSRRVMVEAIEVERGRVQGVRTSEGRIVSPHVVLAAGAWAAPLARTADIDLPVTPLRRMIAPSEPFPSLPARLPMVIDLATGFHFRPEGRGVLLAWEDPSAPPCDEPVFDPAFVERLLERAVARVPAFADLAVNPSRGWAGLYDMSPDKHAILGEAPGVRGLWLANGFSGHGVMHAPATGRIVSDLILHGRCDAIEWEALSAERFRTGALLHETAVF